MGVGPDCSYGGAIFGQKEVFELDFRPLESLALPLVKFALQLWVALRRLINRELHALTNGWTVA